MHSIMTRAQSEVFQDQEETLRFRQTNLGFLFLIFGFRFNLFTFLFGSFKFVDSLCLVEHIDLWLLSLLFEGTKRFGLNLIRIRGAYAWRLASLCLG